MQSDLYHSPPALRPPLPVALGGTGSTSASTARTALGVTSANQKSVVASGSAYTLTATPAALDFGTTDPAITLDAAGTYLIFASAKSNYVGATFAASKTMTIKLRRTNNTAADLTGGTVTIGTDIVTTLTNTFRNNSWFCVYTTANTDDAITLFADVSELPSAGSMTVSEASIVAIRLQQ
jgi:hypothetical protein